MIEGAEGPERGAGGEKRWSAEGIWGLEWDAPLLREGLLALPTDKFSNLTGKYMCFDAFGRLKRKNLSLQSTSYWRILLSNKMIGAYAPMPPKFMPICVWQSMYDYFLSLFTKVFLIGNALCYHNIVYRSRQVICYYGRPS